MADATFKVNNFQTQVLESPLPVLVEFTADWCPPCKMLAPTIHALAEKYAGKLNVGLLDADLYPEYVQQYGVMGLPTLILFKGGQAAQRITGYQPQGKIEGMLAPFVEAVKA